MCLLAIHISSLAKCLFKSFAHFFKIGFFVFLSLSRKNFLKILFIYFQTERKGGRKRGRKHQCVVTSCASTTGDLACNLGMCPDWESNWRPFGVQASTQSTEPHQPGQNFLIYTLDISPLSDIYSAQIFFQLAVCIFNFITVFFEQ